MNRNIKKEKTFLLSNAHSRTLINHNYPQLIRHIHDFVSIGIMTGTERVSSKPLEDIEVLQYERQIQAFATYLKNEW